MEIIINGEPKEIADFLKGQSHISVYGGNNTFSDMSAHEHFDGTGDVNCSGEVISGIDKEK